MLTENEKKRVSYLNECGWSYVEMVYEIIERRYLDETVGVYEIIERRYLDVGQELNSEINEFLKTKKC